MDVNNMGIFDDDENDEEAVEFPMSDEEEQEEANNNAFHDAGSFTSFSTGGLASMASISLDNRYGRTPSTSRGRRTFTDAFDGGNEANSVASGSSGSSARRLFQRMDASLTNYGAPLGDNNGYAYASSSSSRDGITTTSRLSISEASSSSASVARKMLPIHPKMMPSNWKAASWRSLQFITPTCAIPNDLLALQWWMLNHAGFNHCLSWWNRKTLREEILHKVHNSPGFIKRICKSAVSHTMQEELIGDTNQRNRIMSHAYGLSANEFAFCTTPFHVLWSAICGTNEDGAYPLRYQHNLSVFASWSVDDCTWYNDCLDAGRSWTISSQTIDTSSKAGKMEAAVKVLRDRCSRLATATQCLFTIARKRMSLNVGIVLFAIAIATHYETMILPTPSNSNVSLTSSSSANEEERNKLAWSVWRGIFSFGRSENLMPKPIRDIINRPSTWLMLQTLSLQACRTSACSALVISQPYNPTSRIAVSTEDAPFNPMSGIACSSVDLDVYYASNIFQRSPSTETKYDLSAKSYRWLRSLVLKISHQLSLVNPSFVFDAGEVKNAPPYSKDNCEFYAGETVSLFNALIVAVNSCAATMSAAAEDDTDRVDIASSYMSVD